MRFFYFSIFLVLISCSSRTNSRQTIEDEFEDLFIKLPQIAFPLSMQTSIDTIIQQDLPDVTDTLLVKRFGGRTGFERPLGRVYKDSNVFVVLSFIPDDVGTPIISTYNKAGLKIDSLFIFDGKPAAIIGSRTREFATIQKDYQIQFLDSTDYLDTLDNVISKEVISKIYYIDDKGKIKQK